ncbi:MAG: CocE/NonD family hydrolase [Oceanococcaceae bacterium]
MPAPSLRVVDRLPAGGAGHGLIDGPAGSLEVRVERPADTPCGVAVIAHPHPLYGGTMDNKVVYMLARAALDAGWIAVRFNFRGVGRSAGRHDDGRGEGEDFAAVTRFARMTDTPLPLAVAGFSFGSYVALAQAQALGAVGVLTVAPPLAYAGDTALPDPGGRWWMIHGDADEVVDCADSVRRARATPHPPDELQIAPGVGHFFHGELTQVRAFAQRFFDAVI